MYFDIYFIILLILIKYDNGISKALYCKGKFFFFFKVTVGQIKVTHVKIVAHVHAMKLPL